MQIMPILQWTGFLMMVVVFFAIVAVAYRPGRKRQIQKHGDIPLEDDC